MEYFDDIKKEASTLTLIDNVEYKEMVIPYSEGITTKVYMETESLWRAVVCEIKHRCDYKDSDSAKKYLTEKFCDYKEYLHDFTGAGLWSGSI